MATLGSPVGDTSQHATGPDPVTAEPGQLDEGKANSGETVAVQMEKGEVELAPPSGRGGRRCAPRVEGSHYARKAGGGQEGICLENSLGRQP